MKFSPKQITLDLEEYIQMQSELKELKKTPEDGSLTASELQEAMGLLLVRSIQNPGLFREALPEVVLGKYKAIFVTRTATEQSPTPTLLVSFVRT